MSAENPEPQRRTNTALVVLGLAAALLLATVVGFLLGRGDQTPDTTVAPVTTATSTTVAPTSISTAVATTVSTAPSTTQAVVQELVFSAVEDTFVDSDAPSEAFGAEEELEIEADESTVRRALIRFDLSTMPADTSVGGAILRLNVVDDSTVFGVVSLVDGEWTESATVWNDAPPVGPSVAALPAGDEGVTEIDVTSAVTEPGFLDFYLTTSSVEGIDLASSENPIGGPELQVTLGGPGSGLATEKVVLVGAGDIASCASEGDEATAALLDTVVAAAAQAVVFTAGDNAYESGTPQDFTDCYEPSWGRHKALTRPSPGSRDYRTAGAAGYFGYFGEAAGSPEQGYYSYDLPGWHVVVLNSNCERVGGCEDGSEQETWLEADLAASDAVCTIAYWQEPLFSSSGPGGNPEVLPFFQALYNAEAEVVINGNDHFYERFAMQSPEGVFDEDGGIRQFIVGTGGRSLDPFGATVANSEIKSGESFGVLAMTLLPGGYEWDFISADTLGPTDSGGGACF